MRIPFLRTARPMVLTLAVLGLVGSGPQSPPTGSPPPAADSGDPAWDEQKLRAREDVEYLEVFCRAKQAESREADHRVAVTTGWKADRDRQKQLKIIPSFDLKMGEMILIETQTQSEMRRAEVKDAEIRLARARRRLKAIERSPSEVVNYPPDANDRLRELELKFEKLRSETDHTKRVADTLKARP